MRNKPENIILISPAASQACRVATVLVDEFGFVYSRINSTSNLEGQYKVSVCSEVMDYATLSNFGCIIHLAEFEGMHPSLAAEKVFAFASRYFSKNAKSIQMQLCA